MDAQDAQNVIRYVPTVGAIVAMGALALSDVSDIAVNQDTAKEPALAATATPIFLGEQSASVIAAEPQVLTANKTELEKFFDERAERWEKESRIHSSPGSKFLNKDYIAILSRGGAIVPLILKRLETSNCDWLWALENIIPEDENPAKGIENFKGAKQAWIEWGRKRYPSLT